MNRRTLKQSILGIGVLAVVLIGICGFCASRAEAANALTFTSSVVNANGSLQTKLTWSTSPTATACTASGTPSWVGVKSAAGSFDLPPLTVHGTYTVSMVCTWAADDTAKLSWTPPTQNTDGSTLTNLAGYRIYYGILPGAMTQTVAVPGAGVTTYSIVGLTPATYSFTITALNDANVESAQSTAVSKVITGTASDTKSITLTVNPVPAAPVIIVQ